MKIGIVDVGGGFRGVYAAGVLDYCMDRGVHFDVGIGVSAGSANIISYAANQKNRNYRFYTKYGLRKEYAGMHNFITKKSFVDLDYIYGTLSNDSGEDPFDYHSFKNNQMQFFAVATDALTGQPVYFGKNTVHQNQYDVLKASCSIPYLCPPYYINDTPYYDGALSDPIPLQKAFDSGCDKVVIILTLPRNEVRSSKFDLKISNRIQHLYPNAAEKLANRTDLYNEQLKFASSYEKEGKVLIVSPYDTFGVDTFTRDFEKLCNLYALGLNDGKVIDKFLGSN